MSVQQPPYSSGGLPPHMNGPMMAPRPPGPGPMSQPQPQQYPPSGMTGQQQQPNGPSSFGGMGPQMSQPQQQQSQYPGMPPTSMHQSGPPSVQQYPPPTSTPSSQPQGQGAPPGPPSVQQQQYPGMPPPLNQNTAPMQQQNLPPMPTQQQPSRPQQQYPGMPPQPQQNGLGQPPQQFQNGPQQQMPGMPPPLQGNAPQQQQQQYPGMPPPQQHAGLPQQRYPGMAPQMNGAMPPTSNAGMGLSQQFQGMHVSNPPLPNQPMKPLVQPQPQMAQMPQGMGGYNAPNLPPGPGGPMGMQPMPQQFQGMPQQQFQGMPGMPPQQFQGMPQNQMAPPNQAAKKLDPEQMPSAIGVMQEDQQSRGGVFQTGARGALPPLVTTKFLVEDQGNASPRFVRSTVYAVPSQPDMLKQTAVPFALVINPFESPAEDESPLACVDLGPMGPIRCIRCKAYMSPLMQFIDGGRRFQCLLCKATTEVPPEYFQHMDHTGQRVDKWERPELWRGTYEYIATTEYCRNSVMPKEPGYIFAIDVSYNNVKSGLVNLLCSRMLSVLESLPSHTPVGFITYNSKVHFYNIDPTLANPQMVVVPDIADMFMPLLTGFLVPRAEAVNSITTLMNQIPAMFADTKETDAVLGPAIQAGMEALKASERVGKVLIFQSSLPVFDAAPGKLKNREGDRRLLGTDKEKTVLTPQSPYYNTLGQDCVSNGVSVDLYLFNNAYIDVATIGQVARLTGGSVNKYTYFQADIDGPRIIGELSYHLSRPTAFDAVMRVRTSTGVRPTDFFGHFYMSNTTDVELAAVDSYKGIAVEIKHDDKLTDEDGVYIQIALLYTSIYGQRRLRIHNLALNTCLQMADLYRNCELDTIINFLAKQAISKSVDTTPQTIRDGLINKCANMLATYRKHCANPSMPGQLILPECLKLLPLYANCILKSDAIAGTQELTPDDRSWLMYTVMTMGVSTSVHYFYPKLVPVAGPTAQLDNPTPVRCSHDKLREDSAFLLENGIYAFLWIGGAVSPDWLQDVFGVSNLGQLNAEVITELPDHITTDTSLRLKALLRGLRKERQRHMRLTIVRQRDKMELVMSRFLAEDRGSDGGSSYVDFLCHMHKEIRGILNQ